MTLPTVIFSHGQESGPWGSKIRSMAEMVRGLGCEADSVDYQGIADPTMRVEKLVQTCAGFANRLVLVGSSMGGYVSTVAAGQLNVAGLFVLAPAYYIAEFDALAPDPPKIPIEIVHGWRDNIVPVENSIRFARRFGATLHIVDGDHRLTSNLEEINSYLALFIDQFS